MGEPPVARRWATLHVATSVDEQMGGSVRAPLNVALSLVQVGCRADVVATHDRDDDVAYLSRDYSDVSVRLFRRRFPRHNFSAPSMFKWLCENVHRYDLVDVHGVFSFPVLYSVFACRLASVPFVLRPHGQLEPYDLRKHAAVKEIFGRIVVRPILRRARGVVTATMTESARLHSFGAVVTKHVAPLPVYEPQASGDGVEFRRRHAIPHDATVVLFLGRIDDKKGLQFVIPALDALKREFPRLWFVLAGSGEPSTVARYRQVIEHHELSSWTTCTGFVSGAEKQSALAAADCFVLPSLNENFGIVVVEALQAGLPVVVSREVYSGDVPVAEGAGISCEPNTESFAEALRRLLVNPLLAGEMAKAAPGVARARFSPSAAADTLTRIYSDVLDGVAPVGGEDLSQGGAHA